jgi:hypothetical protein
MVICLLISCFSIVLVKDSNDGPPNLRSEDVRMFPEIERLAVTATSTKKGQFLRLLFLIVLSIHTSLGAGCGAASPAASAATNAHILVSIASPAGEVGVSYNSVAAVSGGIAPYVFSLVRGTLPPGTTLNTHAGSITGVPTAVGNYTFVLSVSDSSNNERAFGAAHINVAAGRANPSHQPRITISPTSATVPSRGTEQFIASVSETSDTAVTWSASAGTISSTGKFTAPAVSSDTAVTVTATGTKDNSLKAAATVNVTPIPALVIDTNTVSAASAATSYSDSLSASGGVSPYHWSLSSGALPAGIQLASTGTIAGTTASTGTFPFVAKVTDNTGSSTVHSYALSVSPSSSTSSTSSTSTSGYDGPAELPRVLIPTAMANTPAPGTTITVNSGGNLQSALDNASCGDTILLQAGATFTGLFKFPAKSCDDSHWIIVRTSADDSLLPAEGTRLTPCYAGVASLPGRPAFNCSSTKNVLAKLVMNQVGSGPVVFAADANHYRLIGLELTRLPGTGVVYALGSPTAGTADNNIIYDRIWFHGTAHDETTRGVQLGGGTYISVIDSFFTDFHCVAMTGSCTDSQSINGGTGDNPMGPYKIVDNFLEAAAQSILFGGGRATMTPADVEVSNNHMFKPLIWMKGQPGFVGGANGNPFIVKNLFELKNAQRVLLENNIMEYVWGGYSQVGFSVLLTPKNQSALTPCPVCQVTDVTVRYNYISHMGAGMQLGNGPADDGSLPLDGGRYSIHDVVFDDIDGPKYGGPGTFVQISTGPRAPVLHDVSINHITAFPKSTSFLIGDVLSLDPAMPNIVFTNSIFNTGIYPVWSTGTDGTLNCAVHNSPLTTFRTCFNGYTFSNNAAIASPPAYPASTWPTHNFFPATATAVQFVNYNGGGGGNYHLQPSSPYRAAGTDGKDLGADLDAIDAATANVR